ncbi:MAG TPA: peroxiredoxin [Methyloceanibacter sp.]|nr:peroxiredoxin [Methyloceanibacter sp.]
MPAQHSFLPPVDDGAAAHLHGMTLPALALPATDGTEVCLAEIPDVSVVIIYPWTGRPGVANPPEWDVIPGAHGSTPELEGFRDWAPDFAQWKARLFGLSGQTTEHQREMVERLWLPFLILSDAGQHFAKALALPTFATGGENYLKRLTLVIWKGRIETVIYPVYRPAEHAFELRGRFELRD